MFSRDLLAVERRLGVAGRDRDDPAGGQVEVAVRIGRVALDRDLEGIPVEIETNRAARWRQAQADEQA